MTLELSEKEDFLIKLLKEFNLIEYVSSIIWESKEQEDMKLDLPAELIAKYKEQFGSEEDLWENLWNALFKILENFANSETL